ncbi:MAG: hypothetical protein NTZ16_08870 [Verrucomicrobia bacterium]|nr:hypothetical protein [Verrucomicrobiota bacterium]
MKEDPQLSRLLKDWQVNEPLPPRFQERVWKRIEAAEAPGRETQSWFAALFLRPAFATAAATLLLLAGLSAGYLRANHDAAHWDEQLAQRYLTAMNPYAAEKPLP